MVSLSLSSWVSAGLLVSLGNNLQGLVSSFFLSDVQLIHPGRNYLPGDKLLARVLRLDPEKRKLHLTRKPILLREKFTNTEGVVAKIVVKIKSKLSAEPLEMVEKVFLLGQVAK